MADNRSGLEDFTPEALADPGIRQLMSMMLLVQDDALDSAHPTRWPAAVEITNHNGRVYHGRTDFPRGDPENPVTTEDLKEKFYALATGPWGELKAGALAKAALDLEHVENMATLF